MRVITHRITNIDKSYQEVKETLLLNNIKHDGLLISLDTNIAYVWSEQIESEPMRA